MDYGVHCSFADCKQIDFLPFLCPKCEQLYCLDHRLPTSHHCPHAASDISESVATTVCKKCGKLIRHNQEDEHVKSDCQVGLVSLKSFKSSVECSVSGCGPILPQFALKCVDCGLLLCIQHRNPVHHQCTGIIDAKQEFKKRDERKQEIKELVNNKLGLSHTTNSTNPVVTERSVNDTGEVRKLKRVKLNPKVELIKMKAKAKSVDGNNNLSMEQRLFVRLYGPMEKMSRETAKSSKTGLSKTKSANTHAEGHIVFFNKNHTVGRTIDNVSKFLSLKNVNNTLDVSQRLQIFDQEGLLLPMDSAWSNLETGGRVVNGGFVILERGDLQSVDVDKYSES